VTDASQAVSRHHELQPIPAFVERRGRALVGERVVHTAAGPSLLTLLHQREAPEIDLPVRPGRRLADGTRGGRLERGSRRHLFEPLAESIRTAVRRELDGGLVGLPFGKVPDTPRVGGVEPVPQHLRERLLAPAFQLDEGLGLVVQPEGGCLAVAARTQPIARHDAARLLQRVIPVHRDVEGDDGESLWEVAVADRSRGNRDEPEQQPEGGALHAVAPL
jgi:hypothetical protein